MASHESSTSTTALAPGKYPHTPIIEMATGGNMVFQAGRGAVCEVPGFSRIDGAIIFQDADGVQLIRITKEAIYVYDKPTECSASVLNAFCDFLQRLGYDLENERFRKPSYSRAGVEPNGTG